MGFIGRKKMGFISKKKIWGLYGISEENPTKINNKCKKIKRMTHYQKNQHKMK
jgi:hypothetical protein